MAGPVTALPAGLLEDVEVMLGVTWQDPVTDKQYTNWILSGMAYLNGKAGASEDYTVPGEPRTLLVEYVRYARDSALEVFETNYLNRLLAMQHARKVSNDVESPVPAP